MSRIMEALIGVALFQHCSGALLWENASIKVKETGSPKSSANGEAVVTAGSSFLQKQKPERLQTYCELSKDNWKEMAPIQRVVNLYFLRHMFSCANAIQEYSGDKTNVKRRTYARDALGSDLGFRQALAVREGLERNGTKFHWVGSSVLRRTTETALMAIGPDQVVEGKKKQITLIGDITEHRVAGDLHFLKWSWDTDNQPAKKSVSKTWWLGNEEEAGPVVQDKRKYYAEDDVNSGVTANTQFLDLNFTHYPEIHAGYSPSLTNFWKTLRDTYIPQASGSESKTPLEMLISSHNGMITSIMRQYSPKFTRIANTGIVKLKLLLLADRSIVVDDRDSDQNTKDRCKTVQDPVSTIYEPADRRSFMKKDKNADEDPNIGRCLGKSESGAKQYGPWVYQGRPWNWTSFEGEEPSKPTWNLGLKLTEDVKRGLLSARMGEAGLYTPLVFDNNNE
eukprot:GEMP01039171.1.p1 GENE.GEMP01039171.1~~GEMP01039171.1.p1  ORF type:complete len:451 (+),score=88.32 GEMP01039171.1:204-1556(+)